ncbi:MAG: peptidylprolyl isomerase [Bdellovibrionales bacterium]|nr:peptidylprolyl isomerase [Bdellovibrionales bacterium]
MDQNTLAVVNQDLITKAQFQRQIDKMAQTPGMNLSSQDTLLEILKEMAVEMLVYREAVDKGYIDSNLELRHAVVKAYLNDRFGSLVSQPTDEEIEALFIKDKNKLEKVRASHILLGLKRGNPNPEEGLQQAQKVRKDILQGNLSFEEAVSKYSQDLATVESLGDLGYFSRAQMVPEFAQAAFELKKLGDLSPVVETQFGFHLIKLTGDLRGLEHFKNQIRVNLKRSRVKSRVDQYFNELKAEATVEILEQNLREIEVRK